VKRCIGLPGDTLEIIDRQVYIDGEKAVNPEKIQYQYFVTTDGSSINRRVLDRLDITEGSRTSVPGQFMFVLTDEAAAELEKLPVVKNVAVIEEGKGKQSAEIFPHDKRYPWNRDNFGPIYIPEKGVPIPITVENIPLYHRLIETYEGNDVEVTGNQVLVNGQVIDSYTPKMDYYWMMGDNRHNSADSRFWGFVPEDHVVGTPEFIWLSLDENKSLFEGKIRWGRLFSLVR
jgi:signal peptidase I